MNKLSLQNILLLWTYYENTFTFQIVNFEYITLNLNTSDILST